MNSWLPGSGLRRACLFVVLVFCLASRIGWILHLGEVPFSPKDQRTYEQAALAIERHGQFAEGPQPGAEPASRYPPGFPVFVAAIYGLFGERRVAVAVVQVVLSALVVYGGYVLGARLWSHAVGLLAAAFLALEPLQFWASGQLLSESLNAFLLFVVFVLGFATTRASRGRAVFWATLMGLSLAAATFVRPATYYLPIVIGVVLLVGLGRTRGVRHAFAVLGAFLLPIVLLFGGWQTRNHFEVQSWRFSGADGVQMLVKAAQVRAEMTGESIGVALGKLLHELGASRPGEPRGHYYDRMYGRGLRIVTDHPLEAASATSRSFVGINFGINGTIFPYLHLDPRPALAVPARLGVIAAWLLAIIGAAAALLRDKTSRLGHVLALATVAYLLGASSRRNAHFPLPRADDAHPLRLRRPRRLYALATLHTRTHSRRPTRRPTGTSGEPGLTCGPTWPSAREGGERPGAGQRGR